VHILTEMGQRVREMARGRETIISSENERQETKIVRPIEQGGYGLDGLWNDDFHHSAMVAITGRNEAYYSDYLGTPQEFISAAKWGYLYQGQRYKWQKKRRGTPGLDLPPTAYVHFIQNHDQIANSGRGYRAHQLTSPGELRAITTLLLLMPQTPMLFQGQEFASSSTFHYFADHNADLAKLVCAGRARELAQFPSLAAPDMQACLIDPGARSTFERSKIDLEERKKPFHSEIFQLHKDLLRLRREDPIISRVHKRGDLDGAVLGPGALVIRYFGSDGDDVLLLVNLGTDLALDPAPEPLLAPPFGKRWTISLSSDDPKYGGSGAAAPDTELEGWFLQGRCSLVLKPVPADQGAVPTRFRVAGSAQDAKRKRDKA
jgi:maltooligosyltrehalose trehalohydrolase